jgi:hypothetical protein
MGIRPADGTLRLQVNVVGADDGASTKTVNEMRIPGYQIMIGALWAYLGGQIAPVGEDALRGFTQLWPPSTTPATLHAAPLSISAS